MWTVLSYVGVFLAGAVVSALFFRKNPKDLEKAVSGAKEAYDDYKKRIG